MLRDNPSNLSFVTRTLLIFNGAMFLLEIYTGDQFIDKLALWPFSVPGYGAPQFQLWQLISYSFLHGSPMHLLLNMYALWLFGSRMEIEWGSKSYALYYFVCVIGAGLAQLIVATLAARSGTIYPTVGASGGVFGLLLAFGLYFPNERLILIIPPVIIKAKWFVLIYGLIELWAGITGSVAGVAHFAHLGGMLFGFLLILYWRYKASSN
jgi:membrane associated rhomboid family serine protease